MKKMSTVLSLCLLAALPLPAAVYYFQTTGSDSNPCTPAQPCKSFSALSHLTLNNGDTVLALDGVDFNSDQYTSYDSTMAITIDGGEHGAFMTGATNASAFYFIGSSGTMVLRNITITVPPTGTFTYGIYANMYGGSLILDNVTIISQNPQGTAIIGAVTTGAIHLNNVRILGQGTGIQLFSNTPAMGGTATAAFPFAAENLTVDVTGTGAVLTDLYGTIRNSKFRSGSTTTSGVVLLANAFTPSWLVDTCSFENLSYGLTVGGGVTARISNSEFSGNGTGIFSSGTAISFRNNVFAGNTTDGSPSLTTSLK